MRYVIESTGPDSALVKVEGYERWGVAVRWKVPEGREALIEQAKWALREKFRAEPAAISFFATFLS
jgi:hypothetical protein